MVYISDETMPVYKSSILIVDDNEISRIFLVKALESHGFTALFAAENAEVALEKIDHIKPDLIILDIMMPGMDGFECCRRIRQMLRYQDVPILIQTSLTEPDLRVKAFKDGATDFVSKPIYPDELYARVMVHLENRLMLKSLQLYKSRIESELENARQLQYAILPKAKEIDDIHQQYNLDISSHFQPSSEIGGDFWGIKQLFPAQMALWIVDFSGHGVASALNAFRLHAYLKEYSALMTRPGEYLSHLNEKLLNLLLRGQFATMFYGVIDTHAHKLFYACACNPHPIILRKSAGKAECIDCSGIPLGIALNIYPSHVVSFYPGDTLLLYSDALLETPNAEGKYISEIHIMELMEANKDSSSEMMRDVIIHYFRQHTGSVLNDDLTIVVCTRILK